MQIEPGGTLLHYRLSEKIGAGGMGEVWKARDTSLDREVAIKLLPAGLMDDPERLARFEREAKLLAAINHPGIAAVYSVHETEGLRFLAMELVPGQNLAQRLAHGPLGVAEALHVALQVATALESAHARGVIHRDLKPANIVLMPDGDAKVLDFGLAKALEAEPASGASPNLSPTLTTDGTRAGVILGTAAYMSPEQARGKTLDRSTDLWSFGCVLFECLTGTSPYGGDTVSDSIGAILHKEPDWSALPPSTPPSVRRLLRRCLCKRRDMRVQDAGDVRIELQLAIDDPTGAADSSGLAAAPRGTSRLVRLLTGVGIVAAVVVGLAIGRRLQPAAPPAVVREFEIPVDVLEPGFGTPALSPDGSRVVFRKMDRLWVRRVDDVNPRELPGTEGAQGFTWSPDGRSIAFHADNRLWRCGIDGGSRTRICDLPVGWVTGAGLCWGPGDRIVFATGHSDLFEVSAQGGDPKTLLEHSPEAREHFHWATFLPENRGLVYAVHRPEGLDTFEVLHDGERRPILQTPGVRIDDPVWSPSGHIVYTRSQDNEGIWALPFSLERLEATGDPFLVIPGGSRPSVSFDGSLLYILGIPVSMHQVARVNERGEVVERIGEPLQSLSDPVVSPDARRIAVQATEGNNVDIWLLDVGRGSRNRLTFDERPEEHPIWLPSGDRLLFTSLDSNNEALTRSISVEGGTPETLTEGRCEDVTADGRWVVVRRPNPTNGSQDLWIIDLTSQEEPIPFATSPANERDGRISPDGRFLAFRTNESGREEIELRRFPHGPGRWQVSTEGGVWPLWSTRGDRILYSDGDNVVSVSVQLEPTVALGRPEVLFKLGGDVRYVKSYDSKRQQFLAVVGVPDSSSAIGHPMRFVENWVAKLQPIARGR